MKARIQNLINTSRKERDYAALGAYRSILSTIQEREARENKDLLDDEILNVVEKEKGVFEECADLFADKNPSESRIYRIKAQICADLLPEKIDESEYEGIVCDAINSVGAATIRDMGKVMTSIKEKHGKKVDNSIISRMVKERLMSL